MVRARHWLTAGRRSVLPALLLAGSTSVLACSMNAAAPDDASSESGGAGDPSADDAVTASSCPSGSLGLKMLLLIPRKTEVPSAKVSFTFSDDEIAAATQGFKKQLPRWVAQITNNRLCLTTDVVVSQRTLSSFSGACTPGLPWAGDVRADLDEYAPPGKYDSVGLYAPSVNSPNCGAGPTEQSNWSTFAYVVPRGADAWRDPKNDVYDAFIHEWMHGVIGFYEPKPGVGPVPEIDDAGKYGYNRDPNLGWKIFLGDVLDRKVKVGGALEGLGEPAWKYGNIRHEGAYYSPAYLTPARRAANLLVNGSFEDVTAGVPKGWSVNAYHNQGTFTSAKDSVKAGAHSAQLSSATATDLSLVQTVKVKPNKRYLLSGWVRTSHVAAEGSAAATLSSRDEFANSRSLSGNNDWTYSTLVLSSGDRTSLDVSVSLGYWGSLATGTAWFDDMYLLELPD